MERKGKGRGGRGTGEQWGIDGREIGRAHV